MTRIKIHDTWLPCVAARLMEYGATFRVTPTYDKHRIMTEDVIITVEGADKEWVRDALNREPKLTDWQPLNDVPIWEVL